MPQLALASRFRATARFCPRSWQALEEEGFVVEELFGVASLCRFLPEDLLRRVTEDPDQLERFLRLEQRYSLKVGLKAPAREWLVVGRRAGAIQP